MMQFSFLLIKAGQKYSIKILKIYIQAYTQYVYVCMYNFRDLICLTADT